MRILIFGTVYADTEEKQRLAAQWCELHSKNRDCTLMLVDSASPFSVERLGAGVVQLGDNIGHLARTGQDGWGRAFCAGLERAIAWNYDYVVHIEGDSLFRHPVMKFCEFMEKQELRTFVTTVHGTKFVEYDWIETGIMFFSVPYIKDSKFIERYNWPDGASKKYPHTPENVIWNMLHADDALDVVPIQTIRDDRNQLTTSSVKHYCWITHTKPEIYDAFVASTLVEA